MVSNVIGERGLVRKYSTIGDISKGVRKERIVVVVAVEDGSSFDCRRMAGKLSIQCHWSIIRLNG